MRACRTRRNRAARQSAGANPPAMGEPRTASAGVRAQNRAMGLLTVGHGALERADLAALLTGAGVRAVVDVRRFPGSRRNPDVARDALSVWLPGAGIDY